MKYIVFEFNGVETAILLEADILNHNWVKIVCAKYGDGKPISAGTCNIFSKDEVYVTGDSFTLKLKSRPEDAETIKRMLRG
jgi:hypothetical protein